MGAKRLEVPQIANVNDLVQLDVTPVEEGHQIIEAVQIVAWHGVGIGDQQDSLRLELGRHGCLPSWCCLI